MKLKTAGVLLGGLLLLVAPAITLGQSGSYGDQVEDGIDMAVAPDAIDPNPCDLNPCIGPPVEPVYPEPYFDWDGWDRLFRLDGEEPPDDPFNFDPDIEAEPLVDNGPDQEGLSVADNSGGNTTDETMDNGANRAEPTHDTVAGGETGNGETAGGGDGNDPGGGDGPDGPDGGDHDGGGGDDGGSDGGDVG